MCVKNSLVQKRLYNLAGAFCSGAFVIVLTVPKIGAADNPGRGILLSVEDTYLSEELHSSSFGDEPALLVGPGQEFGYLLRALYRFDSAWLPSDAAIVSAELYLYMYHPPETGSETLSLHVVDDSWEEADVTWDTQPSTHFAISQEVSEESGWKQLDVTDLVRQWVDGDNFGVMLISGEGEEGGSDMSFYGQEAPLCGAFVQVSYVTEEVPPESPPSPECNPGNDVALPQITMSATPNPGSPDEELEIAVDVTDDTSIYRIQLMHGAAVLEDRILTAADDRAETLTHRAVYGPGMHRFSVIAWDRHMNGASGSIRVPVYVDGEPPLISVRHDPPIAAMEETITIEATAEDPSGIAAMSIVVDGVTHDYLFDDAATRRVISLDVTPDPDDHVIRYHAYAVDEEGFYASTGTRYALFGDETGVDSDEDSIPDEIETALGTDPNSNDTDNDGLYDHWEVFGFDADHDGVVDLNFPAMGATPHHKDMFVEMDWMEDATHSHKLHPDAITAMVNLYRDYGIRLHIDTGQLGGGNAVPHDDNVKQCASGCDECTVNEWEWIAATKHDNFDPARIGIFFYVSAMHPCDFGPKSMQYGGDLMLPLSHNTTVARQVTFFFHELGHAVGLGHGGQLASSRTVKTLGPDGDFIDVAVDWAADGEHTKPNYLSNMNYRYQWWLRFLPEGGDPDLDTGDSIYVYSYSRVDSELDENALDEMAGVDGSASFGTYVWRRGDDTSEPYVLYNERMRGTFYMWLYPEETCPNYNLDWALADGSPVDWNYNGEYDDAILSDYDINGHCKNSGTGCDCGNSTMTTLVSRDEIPLLRTKISGSLSDIRFGFDPITGDYRIPEVRSNPDGTDENPLPDALATGGEYCDGMDNDGDGLIDEGFADTDGDDIADEIDNCPYVANQDQADMNHDGKGDRCDTPPSAPAGLALGERNGLALVWTPSAEPGQLGYNVYRQLPGEPGMVRLEPAFPSTLEAYYAIDCAVGARYAVSAVDLYMLESPSSNVVALTANEANAYGCGIEPEPDGESTCDDGQACTADEPAVSAGNCTHTIIPNCTEPIDPTDTDSDGIEGQDGGPIDTQTTGMDTGSELNTERDTGSDTKTEIGSDTKTDTGADTETSSSIESDGDTGDILAMDSETGTSTETETGAGADKDTGTQTAGLSENDSLATESDSGDAGADAGQGEKAHGGDGCGCATAGRPHSSLLFLLQRLF